MGLTNVYILPINRIADLFRKIQDGQAPDRFTHQLLKDWGFKSKNDRAFIPLLKALGFLTADGKPTQYYLDYRDHSRSKQILGRAVREAYEDLFLIKEHPTAADRTAIEGKFKSFHNVSDNVATLMAKTFLALLPLADLSAKGQSGADLVRQVSPSNVDKAPTENVRELDLPDPPSRLSLNYNIQIHLPATKDVEVYNAIFKSLRDNLVD